MLTLIKTPDANDPIKHNNPKAFRFLLLLSYSAVLFNGSAAMSQFVMLDRLGEIPMRWASRSVSKAREGSERTQKIEDLYSLERYEAGGRWTWAKWHCFVSMMAGSACMIFQTCLFIWLQEVLSVAIVMSFVSIVAAVPLFMFYFGD
ncbi:hypothetical protein FRB96_003766 [Tulasnella sp. 330]|nr:hypothetical protein FRB96_003766 [Tulasnella sp. 330]